MTTAPILVTGGTGTLGGRVVRRLQDAGLNVRVLSRHAHQSGDGVEYTTGDLLTGEGIDAAVDGVETVVHCAGGVRGDDTAAGNLVLAASRAGVRHLLLISVVGVDRVPVTSGVDRLMFGYFASKLAAERIVIASGLPWTILRATQFHQSLIIAAQAMGKMPAIPVPAGFRFQPIDADEVADRMVELALGPPAGLVPEAAGPHVYGMDDLIRKYLQAHGKHRLMVPLPIPGGAARAVRAGAVLSSSTPLGTRTWEDAVTRGA